MNAPIPGAEPSKEEHKPTNFLRGIIDRDLEQGTYASRRWAVRQRRRHHEAGEPDPPRFAPAFRRSPTATCTWGTPRAFA